MKIDNVITDGKASSTGILMRQMVDKYYLDMASYASFSPLEIYTLIRNLPYRPDPDNVETLMRPMYTMMMRGTGGDCDDKAIAFAAWAKLRGYSYHFVAIRRAGRPTFHHVAVELFMQGQWIFFDPTYRFNGYAVKRDEAERVII